MSQQIQLDAELRKDVGKGASRRLRRLQDAVPGIVYGGEGDAVSVTLKFNQLTKAMQLEAFYSQILDLSVDGTKEQVVVRDLQRHPASERVQHIDALRNHFECLFDAVYRSTVLESDTTRVGNDQGPDGLGRDDSGRSAE